MSAIQHIEQRLIVAGEPIPYNFSIQNLWFNFYKIKYNSYFRSLKDHRNMVEMMISALPQRLVSASLLILGFASRKIK